MPATLPICEWMAVRLRVGISGQARRAAQRHEGERGLRGLREPGSDPEHGRDREPASEYDQEGIHVGVQGGRHAMKRFPHAVRLLEGIAVERHTQSNLVRRYASLNVVSNSSICGEGSRG